ncbi:MAG: GTP-binding protein [Lachnospiraceae bacterium]|nr:GTP-binding protein [Lachnospiraceae bacterium]
MGGHAEHTSTGHICVGLLAHVDAGKTTLAESLLYLSGAIRRPGRVDDGDAFLDTYALERQRGITIFSKQAEFVLPKGADLPSLSVTLLDTPGHVDFSAEMERTLQVLDYAVLVISGADGIQSHVETLWKLLERYRIPTVLFVNKMDQAGTDPKGRMQELCSRLSDSCVFFDGWSQEGLPAAWQEQQMENLAMCGEEAMDQYLDTGSISLECIAAMISERRVFPCYFGSALRQQGISQLMEGMARYLRPPQYPADFGARVYKISRDKQGSRLTHMKITGGSLRPKEALLGRNGAWEEKVNQLRRYSGDSYELLMEARAGEICVATGLSATCVGEGLGAEAGQSLPLLEPVLTFQLKAPEGTNLHALLLGLRQLEEEEPLLRVVWQEETSEILVQLMGEVQTEVLTELIRERFQVPVTFGAGSIVYKETLLEPVEGVGHFEPLRHYAEVHLLLEPGEAGSGLQFDTDCSEDLLDRNWQRLILTHLGEKKHRGVLTGAEITDLKITLIAGKAHQKHTEGGDFRQATYRAVRQGLRMGRSVLLEPVYEFELEVPAQQVGRAMSDLQRMAAEFEGPYTEGETALLKGTVPAAAVQGYQLKLLSYTGGRGRLSCRLQGYAPCHNQEEVLEAASYDPEQDLENPTGSVFCAHGAGFVVSYDQVYEYMHLEGRLAGGRGRRGYAGAGLGDSTAVANGQEGSTDAAARARELQAGGRQDDEAGSPGASYDAGYRETKELQEIFQRTYGSSGQERRGWKRREGSRPKETRSYSGGDPKYARVRTDGKEYLLVDGYNIIFGWPELTQLAQTDLGAARDKLMDILCNYQGYKKNILILVFDAYKVAGNPGSSQKYHNIHVVYTKEAETADQYIEKVTHEIGRKHKVTVATSDGLEQVIILGQGAVRMSAQGLWEEIQTANRQIRQELEEKKAGRMQHYLQDYLPKEMNEQNEYHETDHISGGQ